MKEYPILFTRDMVLAILEGRKTQTRRVIMPQPQGELDTSIPMRKDVDGKWVYAHPVPDPLVPDYKSPYGGPGDTLWVREHWGYNGSVSSLNLHVQNVTYHADGFKRGIHFPTHKEMYEAGPHQNLKFPAKYYALDKNDEMECWERQMIEEELLSEWWRKKRSIPSIHMYRWAARILLENSRVRVERVQDITFIEAKKEGVSYEKGYTNPRDAYQWLWDSINLKRGYGWEANPWVWVVEFKVAEIFKEPAEDVFKDLAK